ncbi:PREDICTED: uncharacterized protein LOC104701926 isoform X2 [Camelina sativa]|uniref:Uncharacterized protein LOC104701926 isoform X2 n=1 Tax=Camelina sativa TaxID=90675 RepID=A0ABM0STQ5_CAMSA|nr:PREDICTED: uncharacterized protein LOC104701926 isoform X2 [Camelina sativa]
MDSGHVPEKVGYDNTAGDEFGQSMDFENEWCTSNDSPFVEHNAFAIVPSGLESGHEGLCHYPEIAETETCGEEKLGSSPQSPQLLVKKSKRVPRASRYVKGGEYTGGDPKLKALFASKQKTPEYHPMSCLDVDKFETLKDLLEANEEQAFTIVTKHTITYRFFLDIAEAQYPLNTKVIMSMLWRRRGAVYTTGRASFVDTYSVTLLNNKYESFKAWKNKKKYNWGLDLRAFVLGKSKGQMPTTFVQHVDMVYIPMNWSDKHWVGLLINLRLGEVEVFDPCIEASSDEEVTSLMAPVVEMVPWLVIDTIGKKYRKNFSTKPLTWRRVEGIYKNQRGGGDSGPVAAKFLEMHAYGLGIHEMGMITDDSVDELRKVYAMDAYEAFIERCED